MTDPVAQYARLDGAVDVWLGDTAALRGATDRELLDAAERERADRFRREELRVDYAAAHAFLRRVLSRYAAVEPAAWRWSIGEHGRPDIDSAASGLPAEAGALAFNLSHTTDLVAVAVARVPAVGVDVEWLERPNDLRRLAGAKFAAAEVKRLDREREEGPFRRRFFHYWTLKEAYLKARGTGITLPLGAFAFEVEPPAAVRVQFEPELNDDPAAWQFASLDVPRADGAAGPAQHALAVAVERRAGAADLELRLRRESDASEPPTG